MSVDQFNIEDIDRFLFTRSSTLIGLMLRILAGLCEPFYVRRAVWKWRYWPVYFYTLILTGRFDVEVIDQFTLIP